MKVNSLAFYFALCLLFAACKKETQSTIQDVDQTVALKNVTFTFNSLSYQLSLPAGATNGKSFQELRTADSATYSNPANYSITFAANMQAENKKPNAADAKFEGMEVNIIMDTIHSAPVKTETGSFTVLKNTSIPVAANGTISLKTHKPVVLYTFRQIVAGDDLVTTLSPVLKYKFGVLAGTIPLPSLHQNIPTSADSSTKAFLQGLLNSGIFN